MTATAADPVGSTPSILISQTRLVQKAGLVNWRTWCFIAWRDVANRYQRSFIGPFSLTITTSVFIGAAGNILLRLFDQDVSSYILFLAAGFITWLFLISLPLEGSAASTSSVHFALNQPGLRFINLYRLAFRL